MELGDMIDVAAIQSLMDDFYALAGVPMAVIDLNGKVLVGVGWQDVCTKFHRVHPESCRNCLESDTKISADLRPGQFKLYKCENNMWDMATPLTVGGNHIANIFAGQFFFDDETLDAEVFRAQARKYDFPEKEYLEALNRVPRLNRERLNTAIAFLVKLGRMLSLLSFSNLKLAAAVRERDAVMESLQESADGLRRAQEIAHVGSWDLDLMKGRLSWSDEVYRIFGLKPQEFGATYEAFLEAVHPDDRQAVDAAYSGSLAAGRLSYEISHRVVRKATNEVRWVHEKCEHLTDATGKIVRSIGMVQDITEQRHSDEALRESEEKFRTLTDTIPQLVFTCSADGRCDYLSRQWVEYSGVTEQEQLGYGWISRLLPEDRDRMLEAWRTARAAGTPLDIEFRIRSAAGQYRWFKTRAVAIHGRDGVVWKWFGTCTDIEEQKRAEQALRRSNEDLQQFAGVASHDLQEPLRTVVSFTQLLQRRMDGQLSGDAKEYMEHIVDGARRMSQLIHDFLAYSRVTSDSGRVPASVDCAAVVKATIHDLTALIAEKQAVVEYDRLPVVRGDARQLSQVFQNLIANAIKYSRPDEGPVVRISARSKGADWIFSVKDNGIGFDPSHKDRIFRIFKRLHHGDVPGTGIGLAICKTIVERHGGRIWAESKPGEGSTFQFSLPLE